MCRQLIPRLTLGSALAASVLIFLVLPVMAAPPLNDDFDSPILLTSLPYSDTVDTSEATVGSDDPASRCSSVAERTVWYRLTPSQDTIVRLSTLGTNFEALTSVYQGSRGALSEITCGLGDFALTIFTATSGQTYHIMIADTGTSGPYPVPPGSRFLSFSAAEILTPPNDNFTDAAPIFDLPFMDSQNTQGASVERGEPVPGCGAMTRTVWYAYTPVSTGRVSAQVPSGFPMAVAAYSGDSLDNLKEIGCSVFGQRLNFQVSSGTNYYFQVGGLFDQSGVVQFTLEKTPPPIASFDYFPPDPSEFDNLQFFDNSFDPAGEGIQSRAWDFGDGTTADGCCPTHQYAQDGDYLVGLSILTFDGRQASTEASIHVETHDVAVTRFKVPTAASAGQTRQIVVSVNNKRYDDFVRVELHKSKPGGYFEFVGSLTQYVPVRPSNRTTDFKFTYTFTPEDAAIGKVTFRAVANIQGYRDAIQADNEGISTPTKVN